MEEVLGSRFLKLGRIKVGNYERCIVLRRDEWKPVNNFEYYI